MSAIKLLSVVAIELPCAVVRDVLTLGGGLTDMRAQVPVTIEKLSHEIFHRGYDERAG